jgi:hypothetical protein
MFLVFHVQRPQPTGLYLDSVVKDILLDEHFVACQFHGLFVDDHAWVDGSEDDVGVVPLHAEHVSRTRTSVNEKTDLVMQYLGKAS